MKHFSFLLIVLVVKNINAQSFTDSDIPIVIIDTYNQTIVDEPKINSHFKLLYNGPAVRNYLTDIPDYEGEIGIEIRGNYSQTFPQLSYGIEMRDGSGADLDTSLLGMPAEHDWCLIATYNDKSFSRNTLGYDLFRRMGHWAAQSRFCEVVINGDYKGIYMLCESVKRDQNRVNIAKLDSSEITYPDISGGYIFKNDYFTAGDSWLSNYSPVDHLNFPVHLVYHYPKPDEIPLQQQSYLQSYVDSFETALYGPNFADPQTGYRHFAAELSFVDYFILEELSRNYDGFMHSFFFYKGKDTGNDPKLHCGPVWDFDWAFNNITVSNCTDFAAANGSGWAYLINDCNIHSVNSVGWHVRMLQDSTFADLLRCRWDELRQTILDTAYIFNHMDSVAAYLNESQARHYARWNHISVNVGSCHVPPIPSTFAGHVAEMKNWIHIRATWLDANMPGSALNCGVGIIERTETPSVQLFPNPASEKVNIHTSGLTGPCTVVCYTINGEAVLKQQINTGSGNVLDIASLSSGLYVLEITDAKGACVHHKLTVSR